MISNNGIELIVALSSTNAKKKKTEENLFQKHSGKRRNAGDQHFQRLPLFPQYYYPIKYNLQNLRDIDLLSSNTCTYTLGLD